MIIKNILLTGGNGKVGRALLPELVSAGYHVRALEFDDGIPVQRLEGVEIVPGDLSDPALAPELIKDMDAVIHLANVKENRELFMDVNVKGTFYLLDACKDAGNIKQFIQAGSDARAGIYYNPRPDVIDETFPHWGYPGYYPLSKILEETMCEQYIRMYAMPITILRFSWVHAEDDILTHATIQEPEFGVPVWKDLASEEQLKYFETGADAVACMNHTDGSPCIRHIVGIKDVVHGCMASIGNAGSLGEAFAITGPSAFSYRIMAEHISQKLDIPVMDFVNPEYHDFQHSLAKSRSILGYDPQYDIIRIIDDAIAFRKAGKERSPLLYIG